MPPVADCTRVGLGVPDVAGCPDSETDVAGSVLSTLELEVEVGLGIGVISIRRTQYL